MYIYSSPVSMYSSTVPSGCPSDQPGAIRPGSWPFHKLAACGPNGVDHRSNIADIHCGRMGANLVRRALNKQENAHLRQPNLAKIETMRSFAVSQLLI